MMSFRRSSRLLLASHVSDTVVPIPTHCSQTEKLDSAFAFSNLDDWPLPLAVLQLDFNRLVYIPDCFLHLPLRHLFTRMQSCGGPTR